MFDVQEIRSHFPILSERPYGRPLIYLDNAATMQMPDTVMDSVKEHYERCNGNVHRGIHYLSNRSSLDYEEAREKTAAFLRVPDSQEIIFTSGTTQSINMVAWMLAEKAIRQGDEILTTQMEHHSNLLIWQHIVRKKQAVLKYVPVDENGHLEMECFRKELGRKTKLVALTQLSNVTGIENPIREMIRTVRERSDAAVLVDGAQGIVHCKSGLQEMDCDFYCFSGHKLAAPTGTGVLYMKKKWQTELEPAWYGGGTVASVTMQDWHLLDTVERFEPGTPNYAGSIGLGAAIDFFQRYDLKERLQYELELMRRLEQGLSGLEGIGILGKSAERRGALSVKMDGVSPYDMAKFLDQYGIAVRSGHHCSMPYLNALGTETALRISPTIYNTAEEIDFTVEKLREVLWMIRPDKARSLYKNARCEK